jgi:hypothetical protein
MSTPVIATPSSLAMARSPQFVTGKNNALDGDKLDAMNLNLRISAGALALGAIDYSLNKSYSINQVINFEVSDLVREKFQHPFGKAFITEPSASETGEALWVIPTGDWTYSDSGAPAVIELWPIETETAYAYLTTDGYKLLGELQNAGVTQGNLVTPRPFQVLAGNSQSLAVSYNTYSGVNGFTIEIDGLEYWFSLKDELGWANTTTTTTQMVIYIPSGVTNVATFLGVTPTDEYTINLLVNNECISYNDRVKADGGVVEGLNCLCEAVDALGGNDDKIAHNFTVLCEPKYTPYLMQFVNRYGVSDYITFFKRSDESGSFTQDQYQKSIYADGFTDVDYNNGKYQSFNINSRNTLSLNTGFVDESYGSIVEEIMMSEKVAIYEDDQWVAVVPQRGTVNYLKSVNDGLINYTLSFTYAFDQRMLVR